MLVSFADNEGDERPQFLSRGGTGAIYRDRIRSDHEICEHSPQSNEGKGILYTANRSAQLFESTVFIVRWDSGRNEN